MKPIYFILFILFAFACKESNTSQQNQVKRAPIEFKKEAELDILDEADNLIIKLDIELAETAYEQETGLMYRENMEAHQGMLFVYNEERPRPSFYMKNTKIALDLIYLDSDFKVVDFNLNAQPMDENLLSSKVPSQYVLEVVSGFVDQHNIQLGTKTELKRL